MSKALYFFPLLAGVCVCTQGMINGHWQARIGVHYTVAINGIIVTVFAILFFLIGNRTSMQEVSSTIEPWIVLNGLCGFTILTIAALTFPRIGAASVIVLMLTGQLVTGVLIDHFGLLNIPRHPVSLMRVAGVIFVFLGVALTTKG
jgi:transporter family-2 protein